MSEIIIFKVDNNAEIHVKLDKETVWLNRKQIAILFERDVKTIGKHINNIFFEKELNPFSVVAKIATTAKDGKTYQIDYYNLDVIISVGYRVKSQKGVVFRQWATQRLKEYLVKGYAVNQKQLEENKTQFLQTLEDLKLLTQNNTQIETEAILSLIQSFSNTFFALDSYDKNEFPKLGEQIEIETNAGELKKDLQQLKSQLIQKGEASELFAQEKRQGNLEGIFGTVFQSVFGQDAYPSVEEKAAHLLYFIIKNHPFNDDNKRNGAFSFVWLLQKSKLSISRQNITRNTYYTNYINSRIQPCQQIKKKWWA